MIALAGFLTSLFSGVALMGLAASVGGLFFLFLVLRPVSGSLHDSAGLAASAIRLIAAGALVLAGARTAAIVAGPWALADDMGHWPLAEFLGTGFARAGLAQVAFASGVALCGAVLLRHPGSRPAWLSMSACATLMLASGAWLTHGASRLEHSGQLMTVTLLHQFAAAVWAGAVMHLFLVWRKLRTSPAKAELWPRILARFSPLGMAAVAALVGFGTYLGWRYVGDLRGLIGTGYGTMVLGKAVLLAAALSLAALNFFHTRRCRAVRNCAGAARLVPVLIEAELALLTVALLAAATITSQAPSVDVAAERATPREVLQALAPKMPRLVPPPRAEFLASTTSSLDFFSARSALQRDQSDFNHNVAGLLVLAAAMGALLAQRRGDRGSAHWPLLFVPLALFLILLGEPSGWPLGNEGFWETLAAPSVLQHRLATLLVIGLALLEWRVEAGGLAATRWRLAFPLLCVAGGALLLTHTHTLFATKTEFLIEITHETLGILALLMGIGLWLQRRLPRIRSRLPGALWTTCFIGLGLVLIFYRES